MDGSTSTKPGTAGKAAAAKKGAASTANKTQATRASAESFISSIADAQRRSDCQSLAQWMAKASGAPPVMWGSSIVGFGAKHYRYASGREGEWFLIGFSPRKTDLTLYFCGGFAPHAEALAKLGPHSTAAHAAAASMAS
jgi:hypothetical protein